MFFSPQRPHSRGTLTLASPDPGVAPVIDPGYYADPRDLDLMVTALRRARKWALMPCARGGPANWLPAAR